MKVANDFLARKGLILEIDYPYRNAETECEGGSKEKVFYLEEPG